MSKEFFQFRELERDGKTQARTGRVKTAHGEFETPVFMPVATQATIKGLTPDQILNMNAEVILSNTYHLYIRPGIDIKKL